MKILFIETENWEQEYLKEKFAGNELVFRNRPEILPEDANTEVLCTFLGCPIAQAELEKMPNLKYIATRSTGFDHIDLKAAAAKSIPVSNVPTYGENTVAEFTFALLLALSRKVYPAAKQVKEQGLFETRELQGFDLKDKVIGVIGTGHIGTYVVKIAHGFGMKIVAYDPYPNQQLAKDFEYTYASLEELLKTSDVITLHVPYMPATHHLLNAENLKLVKPGAVLLNTSRGGLVETAGLVEALKTGKLAGAGLDVLEEEGFVKEEAHLINNPHPNLEQIKVALADHELMHMPNVLITPHNAFNSREAVMRILDTTVANIQGFMNGKPANLVK
ncbi:MAG: hydroxyacid dehydrogenase [Candidatus Doudnabacteria bacterium]|nr:hydroxyacid dehydrogenase [Candidatus Doudnabacteria bacterium]